MRGKLKRVLRSRRSMDRTAACGAADVGSIPTESTNARKSALRQVFCFCAGRSVALQLQGREPGSRANSATAEFDL